MVHKISLGGSSSGIMGRLWEWTDMNLMLSVFSKEPILVSFSLIRDRYGRMKIVIPSGIVRR